MQRKKLILLGIVVIAGVLLLKKSGLSFWECSMMAFPLVLGHTLWIQSSIGYNIQAGRTTSIFFGWGHHLPIHDPINLLGVQWTKEFQIHEPDGNVIHKDLVKEDGIFPCYHYLCEKEGTYRLASYVPTGYYSIFRDTTGHWHHHVHSIDTLDMSTVDKMLISLKYWEWTKAIFTVGKPTGDALKPLGQRMEIMLDKNPLEYRPGDTVRFTVFWEGQPLTQPGGSFYAEDQGHSPGFDDYVYDAVPLNEDGTGSFEITRPAIWHLKCQWGYPAPKEYEDKCWIFAYVASITFEVDTDAGVKNPSYTI